MSNPINVQAQRVLNLLTEMKGFLVVIQRKNREVRDIGMDYTGISRPCSQTEGAVM